MFARGRCVAHNGTIAAWSGLPGYRGGHKFTRSTRSASTIASKDVIFSGIQPTGIPHLGNYLGALRQWVRLQNSSPSGTKLLFSVVDLHALTGRQDPKQLLQWKKESLASLLAVGLDPKRSTIFHQSNVSAHAELMWILSCSASMGYLSRMTQWKSKLSLPESASPLEVNSKAKLKLGLFSYPVLQAADILVHGTTHVPVGEDQAQHLEFARECATNFNAAYGTVMVEPKTLISSAKRVMSLKEPTLKMSKSHEDPRSRILLTDSHEEIHKKVRVALTDSKAGISYDPKTRPGVSNLLDILSHLDDDRASAAEIALDMQGLSLRAFKETVADKVSATLAPIRESYGALMSSARKDELDNVARLGAEAAQMNASTVLSQVKRAVGLE